jgi:uncharacterized protein YoxC
MKTMEGVRRVTDRMELVQGLRTKLLKARLTSLILGAIVVALSFSVAFLVKDLKETKQALANSQKIEASLNEEVKELKVDLKEATEEVERLNSFENKISVAFELENILREAVSGIESSVKSLRHFVSSNYSVKTDIQVTEYVLNESSGEVVKVIEDNDNSFVVYVSNKKDSDSLEKELTRQYYKGTKRYADVISIHENTLLVKHDIK